MSEFCTKKTKNEICNLLKELKNNKTKSTTNINNIFLNLDNLIKNNNNVSKKLQKSLLSIDTSVGGGKEFNLETNFINFIKTIKKNYKKDKNWIDDFSNEMKYEKISNLKILKEKANSDNELMEYLTTEYKINFGELLSEPQQYIDRNNLIKGIEKINSKIGIVSKENIYHFSTSNLYKYLSKLVQNNKDKISDKYIESILINLNQEGHVDYLYNQLAIIVPNHIKDELTRLLLHATNNLNIRRIVLGNIKEHINADNIEYYITLIVKQLKFIFEIKKPIIRQHLIDTNLGKKFYKILTNDGEIEVDNINPIHFDIIFNIIRTKYEQFLINVIEPIDSLYQNEMPLGFESIIIKSGADSQFAAIAGCIDDDDTMEIISNSCKKRLKNTSLQTLYKHLSDLRLHIKNNYISTDKINIAQQLLRNLISDNLEKYYKSNPYLLQMISIIMENYDDYSLYNTLNLPNSKQTYDLYSIKNMGMNETNINLAIKEFKNVIKQSEYLNPNADSFKILWGDKITFSLLSYVFTKYFKILPVFITGNSIKIKNGKYIGSYSEGIVSLDKIKYVILINGELNNNEGKGIHYSTLQYNHKGKHIKLFSVDTDSEEFNSYSDELQDFLDDVLNL